jgi:hypothetical protein
MPSPTSAEQARSPRAATRIAAGASWAALVAAAALGDSEFTHVHARVVGEGRLDGDGTSYRLVVQCYPRKSLGPASVPSLRAKPLGSLQRAVTPAELRRGVPVDLVQWGRGDSAAVVAWVEPGVPDLEFDGLRARPSANAWFGAADPDAAAALVVLRRPAA